MQMANIKKCESYLSDVADQVSSGQDSHRNEVDHLEVSAYIADWSREKPDGFWDPGRKLLLAIRRYQYWRSRAGFIAGFCRGLLIIRYRFWSVVSGAEIPLICKIGGGLRIPHPNGIVIHSDAVIGVNCLIFQQVTIGTQGNGTPRIAGHVDIGAGAKILGPVEIGADAKIGANAVVLQTVPPAAIAVGVPARVIKGAGEEDTDLDKSGISQKEETL